MYLSRNPFPFSDILLYPISQKPLKYIIKINNYEKLFIIKYIKVMNNPSVTFGSKIRITQPQSTVQIHRKKKTVHMNVQKQQFTRVLWNYIGRLPRKKLRRIRFLVKFQLLKTAATLLKIFRKDIFRNTSGRVPLNVTPHKILVGLIITSLTYQSMVNKYNAIKPLVSIAIIILQITCSQLNVRTLHLHIIICVQRQQKRQQNEVN